jgi:hypothetical protein
MRLYYILANPQLDQLIFGQEGAIIRGLTVTILLVCIKGTKKTTNGYFLYTNLKLRRGRQPLVNGVLIGLFLLLFQRDRKGGVRRHSRQIESGRELPFFVYEIWQIIYKLWLYLHFNEFAKSTSNTLAQNIKKI